MHADVLDAEFARVFIQHLYHATDFRIGNAGRCGGAVDGRQIVIGNGQRLLRLAHLVAVDAHLIEREKRTALVHQIAVHEQQFLAAGVGDNNVPRPNTVE